jgi:hypothetical protein
MGNRVGRRAQPYPNPPYGGGYGPVYPPGGFPVTPSPRPPCNRNRCHAGPPRR